jgi:DNA integrity scanning protein DisA with diadenylate cyclase activity
LDKVEGDWQSFLNPDGVALVSSAFELVAVGCFIKTITAARSGGAGTRHAAASKATEGRRNVALAMSDDKTLTVYKNGMRITRLG